MTSIYRVLIPTICRPENRSVVAGFIYKMCLHCLQAANNIEIETTWRILEVVVAGGAIIKDGSRMQTINEHDGELCWL